MRIKFILLICLFIQHYAYAQEEHDTTYYLSNKRMLSLGILSSQRNYKINITPFIIKDENSISQIAYKADARDATGFVLDYEKLSLGIAFRTGKTDIDKKGKTTYKNIFLGFGNNTWLINASYRQYKGFYDLNSGKYIPGFNVSTPYFNKSDLRAQLFKAKIFYFANHKKFAYKAAYSCGYRQLKSAYSFVFAGSAHYEKINSDTSFIPPYIEQFYTGNSLLREISVFGVSSGAGISGTLVFWKRFYINLTLIPLLELQFREYDFQKIQTEKGTYLSVAADMRAALGYNSKRIFITLSSINEIENMNGKSMKIQTSFTSGTLTLGYRFHIENTKIIKKIHGSDLYKKI